MRAACLGPIRSILTFAALGAVLAASSTIGCGSSSTTGTATEGSGGSTSGDGTCGLTDATNSEWCAKDAVKTDCSVITSQTTDVCGVALPSPSGPIVRSTSTNEYHGSGPPEVSCYEKGHYPSKPGASSTAKISGHVKIFSSGCNSHDVQIQIYKVLRGGSSDGDLGDLVGTATVTGSDAFCKSDGLTVSNNDCGSDQRFECPFEYTGVPTNTELVIKTGSAPGHQDWAPLYEYNNYITDDDLEAGVWKHDVRALAVDDYSVIPRAAIGQAISPGNGAIAGEVHDCGDVRVSGAVAAINLHSTGGVFYFTSNEEAPLPDLNATSTSVLGLYTALDIAPGPVVVAALGIVENKPVTLGYYRARIFPDAVTAVSFKGMQPFQVP